jgi:cell division septum initiation protein DivIVA
MSKNINIDISELIAENERLKKENEELREHLKKYTYSNSHKKYYETNKKQVMENGAKYLQKLKEENPEKLREYRRKAQEKWRNKQKATILLGDDTNDVV